LAELGVRAELGVPVVLGDEPVGVIWFKFRSPKQPQPDPDLLESARGFAGQASLLIANLDRLQADDIAAQNAAIELLVTFLRHEITRPLEAVVDEMRNAATSEAFFKNRGSWLSILEFLHGFIEQLHWYRRGQKKGHVVPTLQSVPIRVIDVVRRAVALVDHVDSTPPCDMNTDDEKYMVKGDELYLTIALFTLIHNARKFTPEACKDHHVIVRLRPAEDQPPRLNIGIMNRGFSIPAEVKARLGEEVGVRHDYEGIPAAGMGFGCYLCRLIITELGGSVVWEDLSEKGVHCCVTLNRVCDVEES
jgi:K+-sensing histidine kinase KdpD